MNNKQLNPLTGRPLRLRGRTAQTLLQTRALVLTPDGRLVRPAQALLEARAPNAPRLPTNMPAALYQELANRFLPAGIRPPPPRGALLSDEDFDAFFGAPQASWAVPIDAAGMPSRDELTRVLASIEAAWRAAGAPRPVISMAGRELRGRTMAAKASSVYGILAGYDTRQAIDMVGQSLTLLAASPAPPGFEPAPHRGDQDVFPVAGEGDCFLTSAERRWPAFAPLCAHLRERWGGTPKGVDASQVRAFVEAAGSRRWGNRSIGVVLKDRTGKVWWEHNAAGKEPRRVLELVTGCHHVALPTERDAWTGEVKDLGRAEWLEALRSGQWSRMVHEGIFFEEGTGTAVRNRDLVATILEEAPPTACGMPFAKLYGKHPLAASVAGVIAAEFRDRAAAKGLPQDSELSAWLCSTQVEHAAAEFLDQRGPLVTYDMNDCFASYAARGVPTTPYYERFGLPSLPTLGGWLPEDLSAAEQDALLWQPGWATVADVVSTSWTLDEFPYLLEGRAYPMVWLRYVVDAGLATFRLRHVALSGSFFETEPAGPGKVLRKVIGRWVQRESRETLFAGSLEEAERLCWARQEDLRGVREGLGGWVIDFAVDPPLQYPHIRSYVLAYSHIGLFERLRMFASEEVFAVKTDSITLRREAPEVFVPGHVLAPPGGYQFPGGWKREEPKVAGYGRTRLDAARARLEDPDARPPIPEQFAGDLSELLRGDPARGAGPLRLNTAWRWNRPRAGVAPEAAPCFHRPLVVSLEGGGGFGKSTWAGAALPGLIPGLGATAFTHDTLDVLAAKLPDAPRATIHSWGLGDPTRMGAAAAAVLLAPALVVDEASMLTNGLLDVLINGRGAGKALFLAGDLAQCPPVDPGRDREYAGAGNYRALTPWAHEIWFNRDYRSADADTASVKASIRAMRRRGATHEEQLLELLKLGRGRVKTIEWGDGSSCSATTLRAVVDACGWERLGSGGYGAGVVIAGRRETRDAYNRAAIFANMATRGPIPIRAKVTKVNLGIAAGQRRVIPFTQRGLLGGANPDWEMAAASTVHGFQGKTIPETQPCVYVNDGNAPGVLYTAISRVESLDQLVIVCRRADGFPSP